jgi:hypothetical protein
MAESKKFDVKSIVIIGVIVVALVLTIVGICVNWISATYLGQTEAGKLSKWVDANSDYKKYLNTEPYSGINAVNAFAILSIVFAALTAIAYVATKFVDNKIVKYVALGVSALLVVFALLALILTFTTISNSDGFKSITNAGGTVKTAAGPWLTAVGGVIGGAAGIYGAIK